MGAATPGPGPVLPLSYREAPPWQQIMSLAIECDGTPVAAAPQSRRAEVRSRHPEALIRSGNPASR